MINNSTNNNTNVNTGTKIETSIYLKKSELPKNVSSFRNDVGYISESALNTWLKEHSYLSKSEINALISKANLVVIDKINKTYDDDALARLTIKVNDLSGEVTALKDKLTGFISIDKEDSFATKSDLSGVNNKITNINTKLGNINTQISQINTTTSQKADKSEIPTKVSQLENDVPYLTQQNLNGFVKESKLTSTLKDYVKKSSLPTGTIATQEWIDSQHFLTEEQDLSGFATKSWIERKNYVTPSQLGQYAKKSELSQCAKKTEVYDKAQINDTFPTKKEVRDTYITKDEVRKGYLRIEDYRGLKDATVINDSYKNETVDEFKSHINNLMSGFYIVDQTNVIMVKKQPNGTCEIVSIFKDGASQVDTTIYWETE